MAQSYAVLTNGTSAASFADGAGGHTWYKIESNWIPRVANKRKSQLGGRGPYEDVDETLPISIGGSNAAHLYNNISTLKAILDQADDWYQGAAVSAASFLYSPTHATISSAASPLQAAIWNTGLELSENFDVINAASGARAWMQSATLRFRRKGEWAHTFQSASSSAASNGELITVAMASTLTFPGPTNILLTQFYDGDGTNVFYTPGYLAITESSADIEIITAESLSSGALTGVSDSSKFARGGSVLRYTPVVTTGVFSSTYSLTTTGGTLAVFANVRSNNSAVTYKIQADLRSGDAPTPSGALPRTGGITLTNPIIVPDTTPTWVFLGILSSPSSDFDSFRLLVQASSAAGSFDIDGVAVISLSNPNNKVIEFVRGYQHSSTYGTTEFLNIDPRTLSHPTGLVRTFTTGTLRYFPQTIYGTNQIYTKSGSVYMLHMANGGGSTADRWRYENSGAVLTQTATITRYATYLTPV